MHTLHTFTLTRQVNPNKDPTANEAIRLLSVESFNYTQYFSGHSARVTGIDMSPKNDMFLSAAMVSGWLCVCVSACLYVHCVFLWWACRVKDM